MHAHHTMPLPGGMPCLSPNLPLSLVWLFDSKDPLSYPVFYTVVCVPDSEAPYWDGSGRWWLCVMHLSYGSATNPYPSPLNLNHNSSLPSKPWKAALSVPPTKRLCLMRSTEMFGLIDHGKGLLPQPLRLPVTMPPILPEIMEREDYVASANFLCLM
jgi:hypothetical protein